jgi:hypothetical protein
MAAPPVATRPCAAAAKAEAVELREYCPGPGRVRMDR